MADVIENVAGKEEVHTPEQRWSNDFAKKVVLRDFQAAESYRSQQHEARWQKAQQTYVAWVKRRVWEGAPRIPRASIPVYLAFEQIEALIPRVLSEIFVDPRWFEAYPFPGTPPQVAQDTRYLMLYQGDQMRIKEQYRRCIKSGFVYGNGIAELSWIRRTNKRSRYVETVDPVMKVIADPFVGPRTVQIGTKRRVRRVPTVEEVNRPQIQYVSIFDFYIDPNCPSPLVQDARYACRRVLMPIDDLLAYTGRPGFTIPPKERLIELAKSKANTMGDTIKGQAEAGQGGWWNPHVDTSSDPAAARVEVIAYHTQDRLVWLLGREDVGFNDSNELGFIPFFSTVYADMLDRFYALAITDVVEGEQILQAGVINARLDELSLSIHTPMAKKRGVAVSPYQLRRRPDQVLELEDPSKDLVPHFPQNITQQAFLEVSASELRAQKTTGVTDLAVLGTPTSGGNSANRTATGIGVQAQATDSRVRYVVETTESNFIEPQLEGWHMANTLWLKPEQESEILGPDNALTTVRNMDVMNARIKFSMRASQRMRNRAALMQTFGQLMQTFMNPAFMSELARQQQKTINMEELSRLLLEAVDYPSRNTLFRDLTPQELQAMNQPPAEEITKKEMQDARLESAGDNAELKATADIIKEVVKAGVNKKEKENARD